MLSTQATTWPEESGKSASSGEYHTMTGTQRDPFAVTTTGGTGRDTRPGAPAVAGEGPLTGRIAASTTWTKEDVELAIDLAMVVGTLALAYAAHQE